MKFEITCDEKGQFFVNGKPVDKKGSGWKQTKNGRWYYSKEQNVIDRLEIALELGNTTKEEVEKCKNYESRKSLWEDIKAKQGMHSGSVGHPVFLDPADSCAEAVLRLTKSQPVNQDGLWYGSTICFTGQMFNREGNKIKRNDVREIANSIGFVWLESVIIGCVFLVTGEYKTLTSKTKKAMKQGTGILSPEDFWNLIDEAVSDQEKD